MDKSKFTNLIDKLGIHAKKDGWIPRYDKKLDYFYWHRSPIGEEVSLVKVSHETYLYIDKAGRIKGLFVEYLKGNFIQHNPAVENVTNMFTKKMAGSSSMYTVPQANNEKIQARLSGLAESLRADIYKDALESKTPVAEMDALLSFASKEE
jgi:hypothetical protein